LSLVLSTMVVATGTYALTKSWAFALMH
jgi:hypothetical protein